ncbi:MAG: hypothetical protein ACK4SA_08275, partial [Caldilinea sp.]
MRPGLGVKRWLIAALVGILLTSLGLALLLLLLIANGPLHLLLLDFLPDWLRALLLVILGLLLGGIGALRLHQLIVREIWPGLQTPENRAALQAFIRRQQRRNGPRIVAIGGGTGMPQLLRGL